MRGGKDNSMATDPHVLLLQWADALWRACWQGGVALLLVWTVCRCWPMMPPRLREWLWRLAYLKLLLTLLWGAGLSLAVLPITHSQSMLGIVADQPTSGMAVPAMKTVIPPSPSVVTPTPAPETFGALHPMQPNAAAPTAQRWQWSALLPYLAILWLLGIAWGLLRLALAVRHVRRLRREACPAGEEATLWLRVRVLKQMGLRRAPRLLVHPTAGPLLLGTFHQVIIVPEQWLAGDRDELQMALAHELAHVRRRDILWGWLPALAEILFFFHPVIYPALREYRLAQEIACDAQALADSLSIHFGGYGAHIALLPVHSTPVPLRRVDGFPVR
jgi:beta-lactamase regulating signal transducer with metallopeptidase domain